MHDRVYRFLISRHVKDWAFDYEQVVMVASLFSKRPGRDDLYYMWLTREPHASSRVRYNTISDDVGADVLTMPSTLEPSVLTTAAPMLCSASRASSSRTVASGRIVTTSWMALPAMTSLIFMDRI